jgi:hypothetical protein
VLFGIISLFMPYEPRLIGGAARSSRCSGRWRSSSADADPAALHHPDHDPRWRFCWRSCGSSWSSARTILVGGTSGRVGIRFVAYYGKDAFKNLATKFRRSRERRQLAAEKDETESIARILQKVHTHAMNSLSRGEKKMLQRATDRQRQQESARAARQR